MFFQTLKFLILIPNVLPKRLKLTLYFEDESWEPWNTEFFGASWKLNLRNFNCVNFYIKITSVFRAGESL